MKLRFDKNSIRLRVKKSDLEILKERHLLEETIHFPNGELSFILSVSEENKEITATLQHSTITVMLPSGIAIPWMQNDEVGIYHTSSFNDNILYIIVEKDFPCKDRSTDENQDTFTELAEKDNAKSC